MLDQTNEKEIVIRIGTMVCSVYIFALGLVDFYKRSWINLNVNRIGPHQ